MGQKSYAEVFYEVAGLMISACSAAVDSERYKQLLSYPDDYKFDLVIYDFTMSQCLLGLIHKFNFPPMVSVTPYLFSSRSSHLSGSPVYPAFFPLTRQHTVTKNELLREGWNSSWSHCGNSHHWFLSFVKFQQNYLKSSSSFTGSRWNRSECYQNDLCQYSTCFRLQNTINANRKTCWWTSNSRTKSIAQRFKNHRRKSCGRFSFVLTGHNVRSDTLGAERISKIIKALVKLSKYTFLWKFKTKEKLPIDMPTNVHVKSWMPQNDILGHPNTKLFISHCGLLSTQEALWFGIPVLSFPIFDDQFQNAARLKRMQVDETLSIINFTENELYETIKKLLEDPKYQTNMKKISNALRDQLMTPLETATY